MVSVNNSSPTTTAIIVAAGSGRRMGEDINKQFINIDGIPVLVHTLLKFSSAQLIDSIIVVTKPEFIKDIKNLIAKYNISKVTHIVPGGETRQDSVLCGLECANKNCIVAIHDGARPFISTEKINELVRVAKIYGAAAPGVVPKDTVKSVSPDNTIIETIDRSSLRLIQTPQVFFAEILLSAFKKAGLSGFKGTDDCSLVEKAGNTIHIIDGEYTNIKVTTPEDLPVAEAIYNFLKK